MQITSVEPHNVKDLKLAVSTVTTNWLKKNQIKLIITLDVQVYKKIYKDKNIE